MLGRSEADRATDEERGEREREGVSQELDVPKYRTKAIASTEAWALHGSAYTVAFVFSCSRSLYNAALPVDSQAIWPCKSRHDRNGSNSNQKP